MVKYPVRAFFDEPCISKLTRNWRVHVDNYFNYMAGYCGGISLGDARDLNALTMRTGSAIQLYCRAACA